MVYLLFGLELVVSIVSIVCFVLVLIKMFQNNQQTLGIICIVGIFCGVGGLIAFIFGWINNAAWGIRNIMLTWTGAIVVGIILYIVLLAMGVTLIPKQ
jgi:hypothetical protein